MSSKTLNPPIWTSGSRIASSSASTLLRKTCSTATLYGSNFSVSVVKERKDCEHSKKKRREKIPHSVNPHQRGICKSFVRDCPSAVSCIGSEAQASTLSWKAATREKAREGCPSSSSTSAASWTPCRRRTFLRAGIWGEKRHLHGPCDAAHSRRRVIEVAWFYCCVRDSRSAPSRLARSSFYLIIDFFFRVSYG